MVAVSGNTGSAPLARPKVSRDRASDGSIWSKKGSSSQGPMPNQTQTASGCPMERKGTLIAQTALDGEEVVQLITQYTSQTDS